MTKTNQAIVNAYFQNQYRELRDCYKTPSIYKVSSYTSIENEMFLNKGYGLTVISYNTFMYTCAYIIKKNGLTYLVYHTPSKKEVIEL